MLVSVLPWLQRAHDARIEMIRTDPKWAEMGIKEDSFPPPNEYKPGVYGDHVGFFFEEDLRDILWKPSGYPSYWRDDHDTMRALMDGSGRLGEWFNTTWKSSYGVADDLEQVEAYYAEDIADPNRQFILKFEVIVRDEQPKEGGWRWHKWGPYIGKHEIQCEYIYDEVGIDHVLIFHIYQVELPK